MPSSAVVLDTNVLVAAGFNPRSASAKIVEAVKQGELRMVWNEATRPEIERIMQQIPPLRAHDMPGFFVPRIATRPRRIPSGSRISQIRMIASLPPWPMPPMLS